MAAAAAAAMGQPMVPKAPGQAPRAQVGQEVIDLASHIDWNGSELLNAKSEGGSFLKTAQAVFTNGDDGRVLMSDTDAELLVNLKFKQPVNVTGFQVKALACPASALADDDDIDEDDVSAPATLALFSAKNMSFFDAKDNTPEFGCGLNEATVAKGAQIPLKLKKSKFRGISRLAVFIENNVEDSELTYLTKLGVFGSLADCTDMSNFQKTG